jgi:hypothetical protein
MADETAPLNPVFLSASTPDPKRDPKYVQDLDLVSIREAVCAVAEVVLAEGPLVFGGHPAISPLIASIAQQQGTIDRVTIFQSEHFRPMVPTTSLAFPSIKWIPEVPKDRIASLLKMREAMLDRSVPYRAGFFIGGMDGVEEELAMFRLMHRAAAFWPLASTRGAASVIFARDRQEVLGQPAAASSPQLEELLVHTRAYRHVVRELLAIS